MGLGQNASLPDSSRAEASRPRLHRSAGCFEFRHGMEIPCCTCTLRAGPGQELSAQRVAKRLEIEESRAFAAGLPFEEPSSEAGSARECVASRLAEACALAARLLETSLGAFGNT